MASLDNHERWTDMKPSEFLDHAVQRLRFKNNWTKEELCQFLDISVADLHKYLRGDEAPSDSLMLIIKNELETLGGGGEKRGKVRMIELLDRLIHLERRMEQLEKELQERPGA